MFLRSHQITIRPLERTDVPAALGLDAQREVGAAYRWSPRALTARLIRPREFLCAAAVLGRDLVGYLVARRDHDRRCLVIERLQSDLNRPDRRRDIEEDLLDHAASAGYPLEIMVRETDVDRQRLLQDNWFDTGRAGILKQHFTDTGEDGYCFRRLRHLGSSPAAQPDPRPGAPRTSPARGEPE